MSTAELAMAIIIPSVVGTVLFVRGIIRYVDAKCKDKDWLNS